MYLCDVSCYFSTFISDFIWVLYLFFSWFVWLRICEFCLSFERTSCLFYWFSFLSVYVIYFCSDLYYFLSSAYPRFCCSFSNFLGLRSDYLKFFLFLGVGLYCHILCSLNCFCCAPEILDYHVSIFICFHVLFFF